MVRHRLLRALRWNGIDLDTVEIHGLDTDPPTLEMDGTTLPVRRHTLGGLVDVLAVTPLVPWLATPPFGARRDLLQALAGRRAIVEKPLGMTRDDVRWLTANTHFLSDAFVLSYYVHEKFAPALWLTGSLRPPDRLLGQTVFCDTDAPAALDVISAEVVLSEGSVRPSGDAVSSWAAGAGLMEFAIHVPAVFHRLGLAVRVARSSRTEIVFEGDATRGLVVRPGLLRRTLRATATDCRVDADGVDRSALLDGAYHGRAWVDPSCPAYGCVVAYVLQWLHGGYNAGDFAAQLTALVTMTEPPLTA